MSRIRQLFILPDSSTLSLVLFKEYNTITSKCQVQISKKQKYLKKRQYTPEMSNYLLIYDSE